MNELESYITQRAGDFPLLAQFVYPQPDSSPAPAAPLIDALAAVLGNVVTCSPPLFANLARRTLTDLCRLRSVGSIKNIIDHVEREFRLESGTLQSRCKTRESPSLGKSPTSAGPSPAVVFRPSEGRSGATTAALSTVSISFTHVASTRPPFRLFVEKLERQIVGAVPSTTAAAA